MWFIRLILQIGYTALHYAAIHSHPAVVEQLLDKGANPDTLSKVDNSLILQ